MWDVEESHALEPRVPGLRATGNTRLWARILPSGIWAGSLVRYSANGFRAPGIGTIGILVLGSEGCWGARYVGIGSPRVLIIWVRVLIGGTRGVSDDAS